MYNDHPERSTTKCGDTTCSVCSSIETMNGESFPAGRTFTVMVERLNAQSFKGEDIFPREYGCFFRIPASNDRDERLAFWPWQRIVRMYEV